MTMSEELAHTGAVPLVDLAIWRSGDPAGRAKIAETVDAALREVGFLIVTGHGIPNELIADARQACRTVFALPDATKADYLQSEGIGSPGWTPMGAEANGYASGQPTPPDLKETWTIGPNRPNAITATSLGLTPVVNQFPTEVPEFEPTLTRYLDRGMELTAELFELLAVAAGLPADTFLRQCTTPLHNLNLTWYPAIADAENPADPAPDQYRIGPHCDFGTITLLSREESDPPLQIQLADGTWGDLAHIPGAIVVNVGDQLAHWSGGRWRSNPHRIPAPTGDAATIGCLSMVLFIETDVDAMLQPIGRPDEPAMDATQFLLGQLEAIDTSLS